jgi:hypothetical protein
MRGYRIESAVAQRPSVALIPPSQTSLVVALCVGVAVWAAALLLGGPSLELEEFLLLVGLYGLLSACFVIPRVKASSKRLFDIPVFITIIGFVQFGLAPIYSLTNHSLTWGIVRSDFTSRLQALFYVVLGMVAFWLGCNHVRPTKNSTVASRAEAISVGSTGAANSVLGWTLAFFAASAATNLYLLHEHLYYYAQSFRLYYEHLASAQVLASISQFGTYALVLAAVERYCHPSDNRRRLLFGVIFISQCLWGLISGMKGVLLWNFILVALISSLVQKKLRIGWVLAVVSGIILLYPFSNQYRFLIRSEGVEVTSVATATKTVSQAFSGAVQRQSGLAGWLDSGARSTVNRLDLLESVSDVIWIGPRLANLRTREYWWILPIYPFVPRFLWPSKPVEDMGLQFNLALGGNNESAAAITYPGDLYLEFGLVGIIVGMFFLGVFGQWLSNKAGDALNKRGLFLYAAFFPSSVNLEADAFALWTGMIKWLAILSVVAWLVYRPGGALRIPHPRGTAARCNENTHLGH